MAEFRFHEYCRVLEPWVDPGAIQEQWLALGNAYDVESWQLPLPLWAQRPYEDSAARAWRTLLEDLDASDAARPICIYIHIPFCSSKCGFCDSYSFKLGGHKSEHIEQYVRHICDELRLWSRSGNMGRRPVSTVHLGGGTPSCVGEAGLLQLAECCRSNFAVSEETEWALETTVESLTPAHFASLHQLGFRRLHIGVQSMEDVVRRRIGRRCSADAALQVVRAGLARGWIVSVDLLCGLPTQTPGGFLQGIETLSSAGVNGFSLYELLIRTQNRRWADAHGLSQRSHLPNYVMMQAGALYLEARGFRKNLFNHWADSADRNIYFTFPMRAEDCLAVGAIADGVVGDYHYRHPRYAGYISSDHSVSPGLEGGLRKNRLEKRLQPLTTAILAGHIPPQLMPDLTSLSEPEGALRDRWLQHALVRADAAGGLTLTTNGTWFAGDMVGELKGGLVEIGEGQRQTAAAAAPWPVARSRVPAISTRNGLTHA